MDWNRLTILEEVLELIKTETKDALVSAIGERAIALSKHRDTEIDNSEEGQTSRPPVRPTPPEPAAATHRCLLPTTFSPRPFPRLRPLGRLPVRLPGRPPATAL